ncbi:MAG: response regulator [Aureliella sp.]
MNKVVLVVEDDEAIRFGTMMRLCSQGYRVITACDGAEALELVEEHKPDLLLMDIRMPRVDGLTALHILKDRPETSEIPVVIVSASAADQANALEAGAKYFLRKPFGTEALLAAAKSALGTSGVVSHR